MDKPRILILCTGNSCRSQMAEAVLQARLGGRADVASAGSKPSGCVHPLAVKVMREIGFDLSSHTSKGLEGFMDGRITTAITVCDHAREACPVLPGVRCRYHWAFEDPAHAGGTEEEQLAVFRRVRDQIVLVFEVYAQGLLEGFTQSPNP